jgi:hypothetical protein
MFKSIVTWALLATSAVYAAPVQDISARDLFKGLADFERLSTTSLGTSPIGYYGGLQFNGLGNEICNHSEMDDTDIMTSCCHRWN